MGHALQYREAERSSTYDKRTLAQASQPLQHHRETREGRNRLGLGERLGRQTQEHKDPDEQHNANVQQLVAYKTSTRPTITNDFTTTIEAHDKHRREETSVPARSLVDQLGRQRRRNRTQFEVGESARKCF